MTHDKISYAWEHSHDTTAYSTYYLLWDSVISHATIPSVFSLDVHDLLADISFEYEDIGFF